MTHAEGGTRHPERGWVAHHPVLFGMLLSVVLVALLLAADALFPGAGRWIGGHDALFNGVLYTVLFSAGLTFGFWPFRRLRGFWPVLGGAFSAQIAGVWYYSVHLHPLALLQWSLVGFCEAWAVGLCLAWLAWRRERRVRPGR